MRCYHVQDTREEALDLLESEKMKFFVFLCVPHPDLCSNDAINYSTNTTNETNQSIINLNTSSDSNLDGECLLWFDDILSNGSLV